MKANLKKILTARNEFSAAINQICAERDIEPIVVLESIEEAVLAAYKKDYEWDEAANYEVDILPETGELRILKDGKDITPSGFGRIAAQTAKQVILQKVREAEKDVAIAKLLEKQGQVVSGSIFRKEGPNYYVLIGKVEAFLPKKEQIPGEEYQLTQRMRFLVKGEGETPRKSKTVIVSRSDPEFVVQLFFQEVPEMRAGSVVVKNIAREAGQRTKIAVASTRAGVDPVGTCVGQKGVRVQTVINELGGEKIDVIQYSDNPVMFIAAALSPAEDLKIELDKKKKIAYVYGEPEQLALAIGKEGQNVRLASKLTGWEIEIMSEEKEKELKQKKK